MRGPRYRGFAKGGAKAFFLHAAPPDRRGAIAALAVCEGGIDALSLAALEGGRADTFYAATTGGIGPGTEAALAALLLRLCDGGVAPVLRVATDNDAAGERLAARLLAISEATGGPWSREVPRPASRTGTTPCGRAPAVGGGDDGHEGAWRERAGGRRKSGCHPRG